jgi:hypothetical protein
VPRAYADDERALTDMEIVQDIMFCQKNLAGVYTTAALEAADPSIRRTFRQMGRDCERVAFRAFEILHEGGHYDTKQASTGEIRQMEDTIGGFLRGSAVPNAQGGSRSRWGRSASYGPIGERERGTYAGIERSAYGAVERGAYTTADRDGRDGRGERSELPEWTRARS